MTTPNEAESAEQQRTIDFLANKVPPAIWTPTGNELAARATDSPEVSALYINLDSQPERKEAIEKELDAFAVPYQRVRAIKEPYGPLGCLKSHIKALRIAAKTGSRWTVVFEDDFGFESRAVDAQAKTRFILENSALAPVWLGGWEINGAMPEEHPVHSGVREANGACTTTSCYFVRRDYINVLLGTWEAGLARLVANLSYCVEMKLRNDVEEIRKHLWWYDADCAWAPLQPRDHWLLFWLALGKQLRHKFQSGLIPSTSRFETSGYLEVTPDKITTVIG